MARAVASTTSRGPGEAEQETRQPEAALLEVAVSLPVSRTYTYRLPYGAPSPARGARVLVPFGRRLATGFVLGEKQSAPEGVTLRDVSCCLDDDPVVPEDVLSLCEWAASYYQHPPGEVIRAALPPGMTASKGRRAVLTAEGRRAVREGSARALRGSALEALATLERAGSGGARVGGRAGGLPPAAVARLVASGLARIRDDVAPSKIGPRTEKVFFALVDEESWGEVSSELRRAPAQEEVLGWLVARGRVTAEELRAAFPKWAPAVARLVERGLVSVEEARARSAGAGTGHDSFEPPTDTPEPTPDQSVVLERLRASLGGGYSPFLLRGVTGSGKTEVYLRLVEDVISRGGGALVLVPEIALTPQLAGRFRARFGETVAVLHSGISGTERYDEWWRLRRGEARVAVGVRSAVFAPVPDLGLIVVDEEHDGSFKQEEGLRYQARDLALVRAKRQGALALLGSATPSLESLENARRGKFTRLDLPRRVEGRSLPSVEIVDLRDEPVLTEPPSRPDAPDSPERRWLLTDRLARELRSCVASGHQAIVFLNRRGHAPSLVCPDCGEPARCKSCEVGLTLHRRPSRQLCHYCGYERPPSPTCEHCGGALREVGVGTQAIEDEVRARVPGARVTRLDRDSTSRKGSLYKLLADFARGKTDVLVGTQMVAKGHDFPGVTLVGVVLADAGLLVPDFRASERTFQLLAQVSGRAGRGKDPGRVLIQSWRPEQPAVMLAASGDHDGFAEQELAARRAGRWPPFCRLLMVRVDGANEHKVRAVADALAARAESVAMAHPETMLEVLGPAPAPLARLRGRHRWQLLIKGPSAPIIGWIGGALSSHDGVPGVDVALDVDPVGML